MLKHFKEWVQEKSFQIVLLSFITSCVGVSTYLVHREHHNRKIEDPTASLRKRYENTQSHTQTRIEKRFGIVYRGFMDETTQNNLEENLAHVQQKNPKLLDYCKKIIVHNPQDLQSDDLKDHIYFGGRAYGPGTIELCNTNLNTLVHELGHILHYNTPKTLNETLEKIFDTESYSGKKTGVTGDWHYWIFTPQQWADGSPGPKQGFVRPYGTKNHEENIATYTEKAFDPTFWSQNPEVLQNPKYRKTLDLLHAYGFVSDEQYKTINDEINACLRVEEHVTKALKNLHPPTIVLEHHYEFGATYTLFDNTHAHITYGSGVHGRSALSVNVQITPQHYQTWMFQWNNHGLFEPTKDPLAQRIAQELKKQGYEKLYDDAEWNKVIAHYAEAKNRK